VCTDCGRLYAYGRARLRLRCNACWLVHKRAVNKRCWHAWAARQTARKKDKEQEQHDAVVCADGTSH
jgi:predicted  nucleic acid-binding Zn-ribbon protein